MALNKEKIFERVKLTVREVLQIDDSKLIKSSTTFEDLGADSLDLVELVMAIEKEFEGIIPGGVPDTVLENIKTIDDLVKYIEQNNQ